LPSLAHAPRMELDGSKIILMKEDDSNAYYEIYSSQLNGRDFIVKGSTPCLYDLLFKVTQQGTYDVSFSQILEPKVNNKI